MACITSIHVRRVGSGDLESLAWLVSRYSPLLHAQAEVRLTHSLRSLYEPADLVNDVWSRSLASLKDLEPHEGSYSRAVLKFLSTVLVRRVITLAERRLSGQPPETLVAVDGSTEPGLANLRDEASGVVTNAVRTEASGMVHEAIRELEPQDREIIVLGGIEQRRPRDVAVMLDVTPNVLAQRYRRALARLRKRLPASLFDELADEVE